MNGSEKSIFMKGKVASAASSTPVTFNLSFQNNYLFLTAVFNYELAENVNVLRAENSSIQTQNLLKSAKL